MLLLEEVQARGVAVVFAESTRWEQHRKINCWSRSKGVIAEYEHRQDPRSGPDAVGSVMPHGASASAALSKARLTATGTLTSTPVAARRASEVIEEEAKVVRQIFTWVGRDGCSLREVARRLQQQGLRTRGLPGRCRWDSGTVGGHECATLPTKGSAFFGEKTVRRAPRPRPACPPGPTPGGRQGHLLTALPATRLGTHWDCCDGLGGCRIVCYGA